MGKWKMGNGDLGKWENGKIGNWEMGIGIHKKSPEVHSGLMI